MHDVREHGAQRAAKPRFSRLYSGCPSSRRSAPVWHAEDHSMTDQAECMLSKRSVCWPKGEEFHALIRTRSAPYRTCHMMCTLRLERIVSGHSMEAVCPATPRSSYTSSSATACSKADRRVSMKRKVLRVKAASINAFCTGPEPQLSCC